MILSTNRLTLRHWRHEDRAPFAAMNADPRVMEFFAQTLSQQENDAMVDRIIAHFEQHGFGLMAAELKQTGEFIGYIGLLVPRFEAHFTPCVEIGWRLAADHWGRGLATEGARAVLDYAFETLELGEIVSFTTVSNARSIHVMEKLGMSHDSSDDFDHPRLPPGHPLTRHVLYRISRSAWIHTF